MQMEVERLIIQVFKILLNLILEWMVATINKEKLLSGDKL